MHFHYFLIIAGNIMTGQSRTFVYNFLIRNPCSAFDIFGHPCGWLFYSLEPSTLACRFVSHRALLPASLLHAYLFGRFWRIGGLLQAESYCHDSNGSVKWANLVILRWYVTTPLVVKDPLSEIPVHRTSRFSGPLVAYAQPWFVQTTCFIGYQFIIDDTSGNWQDYFK